MPHCTLTRRVSFAAAHRYRRPEWDDATNEATFGACAWPHYHGHSYTCEVTVRGDIDPITGFVVDLGMLDEVLRHEVRQRFDHRNINLDVADFADGKLIPSGENLARFIFDHVQHALHQARDDIRVTSVSISEDESLKVTYAAD